MKRRRPSIAFVLALAACTSGASGWSSDVCGCIEAWETLAASLDLRHTSGAEELTLPIVQSAAERFIGQRLSMISLPQTGDPCTMSAKGATCEWRIWWRNGSYKGYVANFYSSPAGLITHVSVVEHVWAQKDGT